VEGREGGRERERSKERRKKEQRKGSHNILFLPLWNMKVGLKPKLLLLCLKEL
jgi:hypothetical protein